MGYMQNKMNASINRQRVMEQLKLLGDFTKQDQLQAEEILKRTSLTSKKASTLISRVKALYDGDILAALKLAVIDL